MYNLRNVSSLHNSNIGTIIRLVLSGESFTRIDLANKSGLTKMSISNLVGELTDADILEEAPLNIDGRKGRPTIGLSLSLKAPKVLCIYAGFDKTVVSLSDLCGRPLQTHAVPFKEGESEGRLEDTVKCIDEILRSSINERILAISISYAEGDYGKSKANEGGSSIDPEIFSNQLSQKYKLPSYFCAESDAAAFIESAFGSAKNMRDVLYVNIDRDITSGVIFHGLLMSAEGSISPNIGHLSIDYNGLTCSCGNRGCLQAYVSTAVMEKKLQDITKLKLDFMGFCDLQSKKNDARIDWAFKDMMDKLGFALVSTSNLLDPEIIIIGGLGYFLPDRYLSKLEKYVDSKRIHTKRSIKVVKAKYKNESAIQGSVSAFLSRVIYGVINIV